jgi:hypothetical protein
VNNSVNNKSLLSLDALKVLNPLNLLESKDSQGPSKPTLEKSQSFPVENKLPEKKLDIQKSSSETNKVMSENVQKASRNLEKLKQMDDKSDQMANEAQDFLAAAKALRKQNEGWF